ncbi:MAG: hypothetical protein HGGPFJEG_00089 [Ignavibacteria bacterium]|nr:hypothetical protein [Ignavibacteria bacterium]
MKSLDKIILIFALILTYNSVFAQTGSISGSVTDDKTNLPVEAASVSLVSSKDSIILNGTETGADGKFKFSNLSPGNYGIRVNLIGYSKVYISGIIINNDNPSVNLKPLKLKSGETTTEEINVEAERSAIEFKEDKKIFNVEQGMNVQGGSAIDVLKNIPSVSVDADGNISLRGNENVKILVDGKPFGLNNAENRNSVLDQIPSSLIESVELVTNPSAKYDADNSAGIINLRLKKSEGLGYNGNLLLNAGSKDKYNGSLNLNFRKDKMNFFGSYDYRLQNNIINGDNSREIFSNNSLFTQSSDATSRYNGHFAKGGFDYNISKEHSLSYLLNYNYRDRRRSDNSISETYNSTTGDLENQSNLITKDNSDGYTIDMSLNYNMTFKTPGKSLSSEAIYTRYKDNTYNNTTENIIYPKSSSEPLLENRITDEVNDEGNFSIDYVNPFSKDSKLETGLKVVLRNNDKDFSVEKFDYSSNSYINDPSQSNIYAYNENIYALYAAYDAKINKFGIKAGLRAEQTDTKGDLKNTNQINKSNYFDLFPSLNLTQKFDETQELAFSYSLRINRPTVQMLNPFVIAFDPYNYFSGNPDLKPEYVNSFELGYLKYFETITINPSIFYTHKKDQLSRTRELLDSNIALLTFDNYGNTENYGAELVLNAKPFEFISLNGSVSYYKNIIDATNLDSAYKNENYSWNGRISANMYLPMFADLGITYFYSGRNVFAQGVLEPFQSMDVSLKRDFFEKRVTLGLRVSDVFNTLKFDVKLNNTQNFQESFYRKRDSRALYFNLTYRFGNDSKIQEKKRRRVNEQPGNDGFGF